MFSEVSDHFRQLGYLGGVPAILPDTTAWAWMTWYDSCASVDQRASCGESERASSWRHRGTDPSARREYFFGPGRKFEAWPTRS